MSKPLARLLLVTTFLVAPALARAQADPGAPAPAAEAPSAAQANQPRADESAIEVQAPDISIPGGEPPIVVVGRANRDPARTGNQVISVLSTADIARTGEGDIAGALSRVTGLSVVGNGYVYVRGLGDRYSLALLNGSPLPSPEPLKRVVPLDLVPTDIIAS
jgi:outer membrane receptor protein involved in Fe transport